MGVVQEDCGGRQLCGVCRPGVFKLHGTIGKHTFARRHLLHFPDLWRLLGLLRHRHRNGEAVWNQADAQLQRALLQSRHRRVLAALAHQPDDLVQGLRLHPFGRQSRLEGQGGAQHLRHLPVVGFLARRQLDLHRLGRVPRRAFPAAHPHQQEPQVHQPSGRRAHPPDLQGGRADAFDVLFGGVWMDYF